MGKIEINENICKGCGLCISVCPKKIISFKNILNTLGNYPVECITFEKCTGCAMCAETCPDIAIEVLRF